MTSARVTTSAATLFKKVPRLQTLAGVAFLKAAHAGSQDIHTLMKKDAPIEDALQEALQFLCHQLLQHIVYGEQTRAEEMLKENPPLLFYLLFSPATVEDYSGRTLTGTAMQLAYGAQDAEMCDMLLGYFDQLEKGREEALRQIREEFPEGQPTAAAFNFNSILQAIKNASDQAVQNALTHVQDTSSLSQALDNFREAFTALSLQEGSHFNPRHWLEALTVYDREFDHFKDRKQRDLFWRQVVGYVQRYLSSCYAQAVAQGIYYIVDEHEALRRSFDFRDGDGVFYPISASPSGLGYDYADGTWGVCWASQERGAASLVTEIVSRKNRELVELMPRAQHSTMRCCTLL